MIKLTPLTFRKAAKYAVIAVACLGMAWCTFTTGSEDAVPVELLARSNSSPQKSPSVTNNSTGDQSVTQVQAEKDFQDELKAIHASGKLPKIDTSKDIKGSDQNQNGVRDDIEAWVAEQPMTDVQKRAAMQKAAVFQKMLLVDLNDKVAVKAISDESMLATVCLSDAYNPNPEESYELIGQMEAMNTSTKDRLIRYMRYNAALSGTSRKYPKNYTCP